MALKYIQRTAGSRASLSLGRSACTSHTGIHTNLYSGIHTRRLPKSPRPSAPASECDSQPDFSDAVAWHRVAGVLHDAVQEAVMQCGYGDELFQAWKDGKIRRKGLPEKVVAITFFGPLREVVSGARAV